MEPNERDETADEPRWSDLWPTTNDLDMLAHSGDRSPYLNRFELNSVLHQDPPPPLGRETPLDSTGPEPSQHMSWSPQDSLSTSPNKVSTLESLPNAFSFYIGPTGTSDISLLSQYANTKQVAPGLSFRTVSDDSTKNSTIFGITEYRLIDAVEPKPGKNEVERAWTELWNIVDRRTALQLCRLYFKFVNPYFPVVSSAICPDNIESLNQLSLALLAGMCATATPFMLYDEDLYDVLPRPPSGPQLYRLCWTGITQELHAPTLATVQACLLLQHHMPANPVLADTAFKWSLTSITLSAAQTIGLHRNSLNWRLVPLEERILRQRVWWAVWTMDEWIALSRGMPTLINDDDVDVPPLEAVLADDESPVSDHTANHFERLTQLTLILDGIRKTYYSVKGEARTSLNLGLSLDAARSLRARLRTWQETLPANLRSWMKSETHIGTTGPREADNSRRLDGNASLHLSYIVVHMMLFRALLRPVKHIKSLGGFSGIDDLETLEGVSAIIKGSTFCARELVDFLENLQESRWNAFWHCWSRPNFAMAGSFMVDLLLTVSPSADSYQLSLAQQTTEDDGRMYASDGAFENELKELQHLIERWRWINRVSANGAAGVKGLTNLGLFKVETILAELRRPRPP